MTDYQNKFQQLLLRGLACTSRRGEFTTTVGGATWSIAARLTTATSLEEFLADDRDREVTRLAVERELEIIGEVAHSKNRLEVY